MRTRNKLSAVLVAGGLALGMAACEAESGGTSPGIEDPATGGGTEDPLAPGGATTDPMAPADDAGGTGEG